MAKKRPPFVELRIVVALADGRRVLGAHATVSEDRLGGPQLISGPGEGLGVTRHGSGVSNLHAGPAKRTVAREWRQPLDFIKGGAEVVDQAGYDVVGATRSYRRKPDNETRRTALVDQADVSLGFGYELWAVDAARNDLIVGVLSGAFDMPGGAMVQVAAAIAAWASPVLILRALTMSAAAVPRAARGGRATGILFPRGQTRFLSIPALEPAVAVPSGPSRWRLDKGLYRPS